MNLKILYLILIIGSPLFVFAQKPEKQISFARENKSYTYYVAQANLWWSEVQKDNKSEENWYNYYRACRSAQGKNDWKEVPSTAIPSLDITRDIVKQLETYIPNTFTHHFIVGSIGGVNPSAGESLLKAFNINPDFEGIHSNMVTYAQSIGDMELRKKANDAWFKVNEISPQLLAYSYNVLMSLEPNSLLLTQHDNDSYPVWMLQDTFGIRKDVTVINIDFIILDGYRNMAFKELKIPEMKFNSQHINDYTENWSKIVLHILAHYDKSKPLAIGLTVTSDLYKTYTGKLSISGLSLARDRNFDLKGNLELYHKRFLFDYLRITFSSDLNQDNINEINLNYLKLFKPLYQHYKDSRDLIEAEGLKSLSLMIAERSHSKEQKAKLLQDFN